MAEQENGDPLIFRHREILSSAIRMKRYPILISILWPYESDGGSGLPDDATDEMHGKLENALNTLDLEELGFLVLVCTGSGQKEWMFYARQAESWMKSLNDRLANMPPMPLNISASEDPAWDAYYAFLRSLGV